MFSIIESNIFKTYSIMKVTYLSHSGFIVTLPDALLVFDYLNDPAHALHKALDANPQLPVIFFVSHSHNDHFNPGIFEMAQNHNRTYVISNDVKAMRIPSTLAVAGMSAGDRVEDLPGGIKVTAYGSTDKGVSFLVTTSSDETIFHAGDLNLWQWKEESTQREINEARNAFDVIVNRIASEVDNIDVAMFPVDNRQGNGYAEGASIFLSKIKVRNFFPMHFGHDYKEACDFDLYVPENSPTQPHCLHTPGSSVTVE